MVNPLILGLANQAIIEGLKAVLKRNGVKDPNQLTERLSNALDQASSRFMREYKDHFSNINDTFLRRAANIEELFQYLLLSPDKLSPDVIDPRGFDNTRNATRDEVRRFLEILDEECSKDAILSTHISQRRHFKQTDKIIEYITRHESKGYSLARQSHYESLINQGTLIIDCGPQSPDMTNGLIFLLLLDQFSEGVWGHSLADTTGAYGHAEDPGSITISCWAVDAFEKMKDLDFIPEIERFKDYLLSRRNVNGGIGMLKEVGSTWAGRKEIVENRRHTAIGAAFLARYKEHLNAALISLERVVNNRSSEGGWAATGEPVDENTDPITTAYVLRVLKDFENDDLLSLVRIHDENVDLRNDYWRRGLFYLMQTLDECDNWWLYRRRKEQISEQMLHHKYAYTTDVIMQLPEFCAEDYDYKNKCEDTLLFLQGIWDQYKFGIPSGENTRTPDLQSSVQFARACWLLQNEFPELAREVVLRFINSLPELLESGISRSSGWAMTIRFLSELGILSPPSLPLDELHKYVQLSRVQFPTNPKLDDVSEFAQLPDWSLMLASTNILPIDAKPL